MDTSNFDNHSKVWDFEKFKNLLHKNYTKIYNDQQK